MGVQLKAQFLLNVTHSLVCVSAKITMMGLNVTGAVLGSTAIRDVSNVPVTFGGQFMSSVRQPPDNVSAKDPSVVLTVIAAVVVIMDFLIVKLVSAILQELNHFLMDSWSIVPYQTR